MLCLTVALVLRWLRASLYFRQLQSLQPLGSAAVGSRSRSSDMPLTEEELAEVARLLAEQGDGRKFCDDAFPHSAASLAKDDDEDAVVVAAWRRPRKIAENPKLFVEGVHFHDVEQGGLGDCWFLSAAAAIAQYPDLIRQVIPEDQPLGGSEYHGIIVFRFWRMGQWTSIYIDDKLPVDEDNELVYGRCTTKNEFWLPLLEKAFAKFHGNYDNIVGGFPSEALLSLTGFIVEDSYLKSADVRSLFSIFSKLLETNSVIACATETTQRKGLVSNHAYTVTGVETLRVGGRLVRLVHVRNPHATAEWKGPWSDSDPNWDEVDGEKLKELGFDNKDDGQFWIKMSHFKQYFPDVYLAVRLSENDATMGRSYVTTHFWKEGINSGGGDPSEDSFLKNPQYTLIVQEPDDPDNDLQEEEEEEGEKTGPPETCAVVMQLIQEQDRSKYKDLNAIGITIFKVEDESTRMLTRELLDSLKPHDESMDHAYSSTVVTRAHLQPGTYIVVPSTLEADVNRNFLMRLYSRKPITFLT